MLITNKHSGYQAGIRLYPGKGGNSTPPPDPRLIEAQLKSMNIQDDAISRILKQSEDMAPLQKEQLQFGLDSSKTAYDQSQADRTYALERRDNLTSLQDTQIKDAQEFNTDGRATELANAAEADVNAGFANARGQSARAMARMGVGPRAGNDNELVIAQAAAGAGAATTARANARVEGRSLVDRAANGLAGYPSMGTQTTSSGAGLGSNGLNLANTGLAGLQSGNTSAASTAAAMGTNATSMFNAQASFKNSQDQINQSESLGSVLGAAAGAAKIYSASDPRLKENISLVGQDAATGLNLYEFNYTADPEHRYRGVMADEVQKVRPDAVITAPNGFLAVDYSLIGIEMVEV